MTAPNIPDLVARLQRQLDALGDGRDARSDNERAAYRHAYDTTQRTISGLQNEPAQVARWDAEIAALEDRRRAVVAKQAEIEGAIADAPDWRTVADARERDREYDRQRNLRMQLGMLHEGGLLMAPNVTYERLADLDARIVEVTKRRDAAQAALDAHLRAAETLLAETVPG